MSILCGSDILYTERQELAVLLYSPKNLCLSGNNVAFYIQDPHASAVNCVNAIIVRPTRSTKRRVNNFPEYSRYQFCTLI